MEDELEQNKHILIKMKQTKVDDSSSILGLKLKMELANCMLLTNVSNSFPKYFYVLLLSSI